MSLLLDIGFVIILLLCVVFGYKKGFFKSIAGFIGAAVAMFLAWTFAGLLANALYQGIFRSRLISSISAILAESGVASASEKAAGVLTGLPDIVRNTLSQQGITSEQMAQSLQQAGDNAAQATADLISPAVIWLLQLILTIILFFVLLALVRLVLRLVLKTLRLPVLRQANGILGALFGICKGVIYLFLICVLLRLLMPLLGSGSAGLQEALQGSVVYQWIFQNNPMTSWF